MSKTTNEETTPRRRRRRGNSKSRSSTNDRPVPLHKRSSSHFQQGDRQRGTDYFNKGRVQLEVQGPRAHSKVQGNEQSTYAVGLDWTQVADERILHSFCECQRFFEGRPCKHIWATLLALGETGPENQPDGKDRVSLRKDRPSLWPDLGIPVDELENRRNAASGDRVRSGRSTRRSVSSRGTGRRRRGGNEGTWRDFLETVRDDLENLSYPSRDKTSSKNSAVELRLLINAKSSRSNSGFVIDVFGIKATQGAVSGSSGKPRKLKRLGLDPMDLSELLREPYTGGDSTNAPPVAIISALPAEPKGRQPRGRRPPKTSGEIQTFQLPVEIFETVLPHLCATGILGCWDGRSAGDPLPLRWDTGPAWEFALRVELAGGGTARLTGALSREGESVPLSAPMMILPDHETDPKSNGQKLGWVVFADTIARFSGGPEVLPWVQILDKHGEIPFPKDEFEQGLTTLLEMPSLPRLEAPDELQLTAAPSEPHPHLVLKQDLSPAWTNPPLIADLLFDYGDVQVSAADSRAAIVDWPARCFLKRDLDLEHKNLIRLLELGVNAVQLADGHQLEIEPLDLPAVAEPLLNDGWTVEAHGRSLRPPNPPALRVETGIDWFELSGDVDFAGDRVDFSEILSSISKGERFVELEDGSRGLVPEAWIETYESLAKLAQSSSDEGLRFLPSQALLVDTLLTAMPPANVDKAFTEMRKKLRSFESIKPKKELKSFVGELRSYQRRGLGWLVFLREFALGGVLADDMGLGKTVQVLALIQAYRTPARTTKLPFLVVSPRSLVYNWIDEASRFTPKLKVIEYGGSDRTELHGKFGKYDLIVTTYGTLRRDIGYLATVEFDTVILDEAQAIKNPTSQAAKASSLLVARNRLALTGTPIENHLGELGSLFEFLNPGLLGRLPKLDVLASGRSASANELAVVSEGIRPFILRRTKKQVLPDLPPKTEQVLLCTLNPEQRVLYDQLLANYQSSLLHNGQGTHMQVLEALLRLRQVACHPGLVDDSWEAAGSAKLDALFEQVSEVLEEGHKVIIFSQFTKLLGLVEKQVVADGTTEYAYLDGQTKNRGDIVDRFQNDPDCNLFLISLKAGGVGLNLTAAEYVFLLDPWWNPAVEAQAIDRAHRIGQTQPVFAYRLIAQDTVEEKILELQKSKRQLADAVLDGGGLPAAELTAEDLRDLLV